MGHGSPRVDSVIPVQRAKEREKLKSAVHSVVVPEPWVLFACWTGNMRKLRPKNRGKSVESKRGGGWSNNADK
jgi:hypothetical protein